MPQRYKKIKINGVTWSLHRYVWTQAYGQIPEGMLVHHKNDDKLDNRLENLELMTPAQHSRHHNNKHPRIKSCKACGVEYEPSPTKRERSKSCSPECAKALMRLHRGSQKGTSKLGEQDVLEIRGRLNAGERRKTLAAEYGVSLVSIHKIARYETWTHI